MDFPIADLMDEDACYAKLVALAPPRRPGLPALRRRATAWASTAATAPRCSTTAAAAAAGSSTPSPARPCTGPSGGPSQMVLILRGFAQGVPTAQLARELGCDRSELLGCGTGSRRLAWRGLDRTPLGDATVEADEVYQNAGEKRRAAPRPGRPAAAAGQQGRGGTAPGTTTGRRSAGWSGARAGRSG